MPYRELPIPPPADASAFDAADGASDDAISTVLIVIGLVPVIVTVALGARFGAEPTVGLALALIGGWARWRRR